MDLILNPIALIVGLIAGMLLLLEIGRRVGVRDHRDPKRSTAGFGAIEGAVFALLGLLIAFTFSGAAERFDTRRHLIVEEANDIGTAYLRLDLLPPQRQPALRDLFRSYVDARLHFYRKLSSTNEVHAERYVYTNLQNQIWKQAVSASQETGTTTASMLLLPALNAMFDITTTRTVALHTHPPLTIFFLLFGLAFACALMAGYAMSVSGKRSWLHTVAFAIIMAAAIYVILDIEYPRRGLIRIDYADQVLVDVRDSMK